MRQWLIGTFSVGTLLNESRDLRDRILFEEIPSGQQYLVPIVEAMREGRTLEIGLLCAERCYFGAQYPTGALFVCEK